MSARLIAAAYALFTTSASAHPGDHGHLDLAGLFAHIFETDHLVFAVLAGLIGVLAFRAGRRAESRAQAKKAMPLPERETRA